MAYPKTQPTVKVECCVTIKAYIECIHRKTINRLNVLARLPSGKDDHKKFRTIGQRQIEEQWKSVFQVEGYIRKLASKLQVDGCSEKTVTNMRKGGKLAYCR